MAIKRTPNGNISSMLDRIADLLEAEVEARDFGQDSSQMGAPATSSDYYEKGFGTESVAGETKEVL